jgi:NADH-quinone oxidoreductase subunit E
MTLEMQTSHNKLVNSNDDDLRPEVMDKIIAKYQGKPGQLLGVLEKLQEANPHHYLPASAMEYVAKKLNVPLSNVYSVATFYTFFNLKPQGEHYICVCRGTACHTKGSKVILEGMREILKFKEPIDESEKVFMTTEDKKITIKTIACFGQCALAPVVEVDGLIFNNMTIEKMKKIVDTLQKGHKLQLDVVSNKEKKGAK